MWTESDYEDAVEATLRTDPLVEGITLLARTPDRILYSVTWTPDVDALVETLVTPGVDVLTTDGAADYRIPRPVSPANRPDADPSVCRKTGSNGASRVVHRRMGGLPLATCQLPSVNLGYRALELESPI